MNSNSSKIKIFFVICLCIILAKYNSKTSKKFFSDIISVDFSIYYSPITSDLEYLTSFLEKLIVKLPSRKTFLYCIILFFFILSYFQYFIILLDISKEKMLSLNPFKRIIRITYTNPSIIKQNFYLSNNGNKIERTLHNLIHSFPFTTSSSPSTSTSTTSKITNILSRNNTSKLSNIKWINNIRNYNSKVNKVKAIQSISKYIKENDCKNIIVMSGAGISTNANIPDFRTPNTGLYSRLEKYNLPTPQSIFDIVYYRHNPIPFCHIAKEHYLKDYKPTLTHYFIRLLAEHNLLLRNFTQNIDGLEEKAGLDEKYIINAHGTYKTAHCVGNSLGYGCGKIYTQEWFKDKMKRMKKPICPVCGGIVKPDIVFFGEDLPISFWFGLQQDLPKCDLLIILGTSLQVQPFASIPNHIPSNVPKLLINKNPVGPFKEFDIIPKKSNNKNYVYLGDCDEGCLELARSLGMEDELLKLYENDRH